MTNFIDKLKIIFIVSVTLSLIFTGFVTTNAQKYSENQEATNQLLASLESENTEEITDFELAQLPEKTNETPLYSEQILTMNAEENYQEIAQADEFADPIIVAQNYIVPEEYIGDMTSDEVKLYRAEYCMKRSWIPFSELFNSICNANDYCKLKFEQPQDKKRKYPYVYKYKTIEESCYRV